MPLNLPRRSHNQPQRLEMFERMAQKIPRRNMDVALALDQCTKAYGELIAQQSRLARDATKTEGGKLVRLAASVRSNVLPKIEALDVASRTMSEGVQAMRKQMREAFDPPGKTYEQVLRQIEIRSHFYRSPSDVKLKLLGEARDAGDEDTLIAVSAGPSYLTGLPPGMQEHTRNILIDAKLPDHREILDGLAEQEKLAGIFRAEMMQSLVDAVDMARADEIAAAAREDVAGAQ